MTRSEHLYLEATSLMPGGVNSPVRAFRAVGGTPLFFAKAKGAILTDADGKEYIDYVSSWGAVILGHAHEAVTEAIVRAAEGGTSYGAPHQGEITLAREVVGRKGVDLVRFVNSGTEASLAAVRLARAATGRTKLIKFEGNYHGALDSLLAKAGSGVATFGLPDSAGVPADAARSTLTARYNDAEDVRRLLEANPGEIAAVLLEPVAGNMGLVPPAPGFLDALRSLCDAHGALLVVDEVMTGFRVAHGGATARYGLRPDLLIMGKVIGGGLPVGAYGGRKELMEMIAPLGPVYQAGTLSGNPLAMAAGHAVVSRLDDAAYERLETLGARLQKGLTLALENAGVPGQVQRVGSMISVFFTAMPVRDFEDAQTTDKALFARLFHALLKRGVYLPPSALEAWFLNLGHDEALIDRTVDAFEEALREAASPRPSGGEGPGVRDPIVGASPRSTVQDPRSKIGDFPMSLFLDACHGRPTPRPPLWLMRQAGRYLPEYRELRKGRTMLEAVSTPDVAIEATLQPIRRFGFDAAILFSDLTVPFTPMGAPFEIKEGVGPVVFDPVRTASDFERVHRFDPDEGLPFVMETIRGLKRELGDVPLIGFTGAPFTLASYLIEGGPSRDLRRTKAMMVAQPELWHRLMELLSDVVADYLAAQIRAGADAVQLFDSWVGSLSPEAYRVYLLPHMKGIFARLKPLGAPVIHFGTGNPLLLPIQREAGGDVIGVDFRTTLTQAATLVPGVPLQGNLDPTVLHTDPATVEREARRIVAEGRALPGHIFNLGHGILTETPLENVERLVEVVKGSVAA